MMRKSLLLFSRSSPSKCSITVDAVKTRVQVLPTYKNLNMISGVIAEQGYWCSQALLTSFEPTAVGYFAQGGAKFSGYEYWKVKSVQLVGSENAVKYRTAIYLGSAGIAE